MAGQKKNPAKVFQVQECREGQPEAPSWRNDYERPMALATHCPTASWEQRTRMGVLMGGRECRRNQSSPEERQHLRMREPSAIPGPAVLS